MRDETCASLRCAPLYSVETRTDPAGLPAVVLTGEVDMLAADGVLAAITAAVSRDGTGVAVDLREVTFMDSSGLQALLRASADAARRGGGLILRIEDGPVARLLELTGVTEMLDIRRA